MSRKYGESFEWECRNGKLRLSAFAQGEDEGHPLLARVKEVPRAFDRRQ
jgi:hypothetical protein